MRLLEQFQGNLRQQNPCYIDHAKTYMTVIY